MLDIKNKANRAILLFRRYSIFFFFIMIVVGCKQKEGLIYTIVPTLTNTRAFAENSSLSSTFSPSSTPMILPTESLFYNGYLSPQPGMIYKQETYTSSYQKLWMAGKNNSLHENTYFGNDIDLSPNLNYGAYISNGDIWLLDIKSGERFNLTNTPNCFEGSNFAWSPENSKLLYFSCPNNSKFNDLYIVDLSTHQTRNLTNTSERNENLFISWWKTQPDIIFFGSQTTQEYFTGPQPGQCHTRDGECSYYLTSISPDGKNYKVIDNISGILTPPDLSPDGKILAYDGGNLYNLITGLNQIINSSDFGVSPGTNVNKDGPELIQPAWSPRGKQIIWLGHVDNNVNETAIYLFDLNSRSGKILYRYIPCYFSITLPMWQMWTGIQHSWSPDGQFLAVISTEWGKNSCQDSLHVFDYSGNIVNTVDRVEYGRGLVWSPDSKNLVFGYYEIASKSLLELLTNVDNWEIQHIRIPNNAIVIKWDKIQ